MLSGQHFLKAREYCQKPRTCLQLLHFVCITSVQPSDLFWILLLYQLISLYFSPAPLMDRRPPTQPQSQCPEVSPTWRPPGQPSPRTVMTWCTKWSWITFHLSPWRTRPTSAYPTYPRGCITYQWGRRIARGIIPSLCPVCFIPSKSWPPLWMLWCCTV